MASLPQDEQFHVVSTRDLVWALTYQHYHSRLGVGSPTDVGFILGASFLAWLIVLLLC